MSLSFLTFLCLSSQLGCLPKQSLGFTAQSLPPQPAAADAATTTAVASEAVKAGGSSKLSHCYDGDKRKRCHCRRDTDSLVIREIAVLCIKAFQKKLIK